MHTSLFAYLPVYEHLCKYTGDEKILLNVSVHVKRRYEGSQAKMCSIFVELNFVPLEK